MSLSFRGFGIAGYRSFYGPMQYVGPLEKVTLLAGQNNAGKSNIIRFINERLPEHLNYVPAGLEVPRGVTTPIPFRYALCLPKDLQEYLPTVGVSQQGASNEIVQLLSLAPFGAPRVGGTWLRFQQINQSSSNTFARDQADAVIVKFGPQRLGSLSSTLTGMSGGQKYDDYDRVMHKLFGNLRMPNPLYVDAFRQVRPGGGSGDQRHVGIGLVEMVAELQNPEATDQPRAQEKYNALNDFVSRVLEQEARLEVPHNKTTVNVRIHGNVVLPLEHQGTGLHQVVIIAATAITVENRLICIEEPEINLHPLMQRRLLRYLYDSTKNQYMITTHSAQMLDYERSSVLHLEKGESGTTVTPAATPALVANVCYDLGYRPSDLLQSNAVVWVEGPSDRIYVRHWVNKLDPSLIEGVHYSIMFYGGSLLSELAADDPVVTEFINLRRLNRHMSLVADSDKRSPRARITATKRRVQHEFDVAENEGFMWITDGYTIENYVPFEILRASVAAVHGKSRPIAAYAQWVDPLSAIPNPKKTRIARHVVDHWSNCLENASLERHVRRLVSFIRNANESPADFMDT